MLFGIVQLSKESNEGVFRADALKLKDFFPLKVGNSVQLSSYGTTNGQRWFRDNFAEVVSEKSIIIGEEETQGFQINFRLKSAAGDFFNFEGSCMFSVALGRCVVTNGELRLRNRPDLSGPQSIVVSSVTINNQNLPVKVGSTKP